VKSPLRVLLLEDNPTDAELSLLRLAAEKIICDPLRVETRTDFITALEQHPFDLILSDHGLPSFDGVSALAIAREKCPNTPFIFVSGTIGEELAIETLKSGATDYVLKQRLSRLAPSVRRAMSEFEERTARQRAESAWREADALFRSVFQSSAVGIAVLDAGQRIIKTNGALQRMLNYSEDELSTMTLTALTHADDRQLDEKLIEELSAGSRASYQVEKRYHQKDGNIIWGRLTISLITPSEKGNFTVAFVEDISARKSLEAQLVASQKMEAVGRLAAGIAHDFNNVLTVISGYSGLLLAQVPAQDPLRADINEISEAAKRATALTKRLLAFGRKDIQQPKVLNLNAIISDLDQMLRPVIGDEIQLVTQLAPDLRAISADQVQMEQVLINLIINARDAMASGGEIRVTTENVHESNAARNRPELGDGVMLAVADTGHGMDEATQARIFEPFFTTKEVGKGTGLGLWTISEIVQQSRGAIQVESQVGRGTTFKIFLPCAHKECEEAPESDAISTTSAGAETILVVEDEAASRELMQEVLETAGYRTLLASDGAEALRIVEHGEDEIHLLITDVAMLIGRCTDLVDRIAASRSDIRILFVSGSSDGLVSANGSAKPDRTYLRKPFTGGALLQSIRKVLDVPRQARIVVADDDPGIRKLLCDVLRTSGYYVLEATNGRQAIDHIRRERVDLLVTDLVMPDQEGIETIGEVRKQFPRLRIMAMSGGFGERFLKIARQVGADHIVSKPFETGAICAAIRRLLVDPQRLESSILR
jgi:two-component system cell cycle sensor histidine kinase/response regulator CckA